MLEDAPLVGGSVSGSACRTGRTWGVENHLISGLVRLLARFVMPTLSDRQLAIAGVALGD